MSTSPPSLEIDSQAGGVEIEDFCELVRGFGAIAEAEFHRFVRGRFAARINNDLARQTVAFHKARDRRIDQTDANQRNALEHKFSCHDLRHEFLERRKQRVHLVVLPNTDAQAIEQMISVDIACKYTAGGQKHIRRFRIVATAFGKA